MTAKPISSLYRKLIWTTGIIVGLALAIHSFLPLAVNTSGMRSRILAMMADQISGEVDFRAIRPALLPWPHAVVTEGHLSMPGRLNIRFAKGIVYPQLWSLLFGQLKIHSLKVVEPDIEVLLPVGSFSTGGKPGDQSFEALGRKIRDTLVAAARGIGLPAALIQDGRLALLRPDQTGLEFNQINLEAKVDGEQLMLRVTGQSNLVKMIDLKARIDLPALDMMGRISVSGMDTARLASLGFIPPATPLPVMVADLGMNFQTRGPGTFQSDIQVNAPEVVVQNGTRQLTVRKLFLEGAAQWSAQQMHVTLQRLRTVAPAVQLEGTAVWSFTGPGSAMPTELQLRSVDLDVDQIRSAALQLAGNQPVVQGVFGIIQGGQMPELTFSIQAPDADRENMAKRIGLQGRLSGGRIVVPRAQLSLEAVSGRVILEKGRLTADQVGARLGNAMSQNGTLQLGLLDGTRAFSLDTEIDVDLAELMPVLKNLVKHRETVDLLSIIPPIGGRAEGRLALGDSLDRINARITATGRINVLDATLNVSGTVDGLSSAGSDIQFDLSGPMGLGTVDWLWRWGALPVDLLPKAPAAVTHAHISRSPEGDWGLNGDFAFASGPHVTAALKISQNELDVKELHLLDTTSDATIAFKRSRGGKHWEVGFNGYLDKPTADKLLQHNGMIQGWLTGDLQVDFKTDPPAHIGIQGRLTSRLITIPLGSRPPLNIIDASLEGTGNRFNITSAELKWHESNARLSGSGASAAGALNLNLALNSDSLDVDKILEGVKAGYAEDQARLSNDMNAIPVNAEVRVEAGQLVFGGYRFAPLKAVVARRAGQTTADISTADLCGIAAPGKMRFDQDGLWMAFKPHAARSALQDTDRCLAVDTPITERLEGTVNADGTVETHGRTGAELIRNLDGKMDLQISNGRVFNVGAAGFFTNLLSFISVNQLIEGSMPDLRKNDFRYKSLSSKLVIKDGVLRIEEGVLKSNAVNMVANGDYGLVSKNLDLVLLVSPLTTVDWIVERIPLVGNILQGTLVAIPVGVKGPLVNPGVVPLSPAAVGSRLGGILERTLKTPFRILAPLLKDNRKPEP